MAEGERKGTVTPLDSLFTSEEAEKAARQVTEAIAARQKELDLLHDFIADNTVLIHHVRKLPDELSHDIMVPFGGAAFFPGRLVHTNEFMVLLGEGYYAERSAKQTVEILQRRGKSLEANLGSLMRDIKDLDAEAKFFESTAAEVAEGLVEIREEYVEENEGNEPEKVLSGRNIVSPSKVHDFVVPGEKEKDDKIMARLYELVKEEEGAASDLGQDENNEFASHSVVDVDQEVADDDDDNNEDFYDEGEEEDEENEEEHEDEDVEDEEDDEEEEEEEDEEEEEEEEEENVNANDNAIFVSETRDKVPGPKLQSYGGSMESFVKPNNPQMPHETKIYLQKSSPSNVQSSYERIPGQIPKTVSRESKAFTGTIIENSLGLSSSSPINASTSVQTSRPVSRFKLHRGKH